MSAKLEVELISPLLLWSQTDRQTDGQTHRRTAQTEGQSAQIWPVIARGSHSFACHPLMNHTCFYCPAAGHHRPLAGTCCAYPRRDGQAELTWVARYIHCVSKKVPTFKLSVTLSNLNQFSNFLHCWKAYEICNKSQTALLNICWKFEFLISQGSVATCLRWGG